MSSTTATMTATSGRLKMPVLAPIAVTIRPTSRRDIMPRPHPAHFGSNCSESAANHLADDYNEKDCEHQSPVPGQRVIIAGQAKRDKEQRNKKAVPNRIKAPLERLRNGAKKTAGIPYGLDD